MQRGEPGTYVDIIHAYKTVSVGPGKLGPTDGGYMAVLSGLQPGDQVVTDGTDRLRDGAAVTVPPPAPPAAATPAAAATPGAAQPPVRGTGQRRGQTGQPPAPSTP